MRVVIRLFISLLLSFTLSSYLMAGDATQASDNTKTATRAEINKQTEAVEIDEETGFIIDEHWELAKAHCTACHSAKHVTLQRGTRQMWLDMIRWMQRTQGLWKLDKETEEKLLNYLAKNYAPEGNYRRAPIPPELLPAKP